jgi:hypothetical protein
MTRSVVTLLAVAAALLLAAPATAQTVEPLTFRTATPPDRAVFAPMPTGGIAWGITGLPTGAQVLVTVASDPATGPDGTLPNDNRVDFFFLSEDAANPGAYSGMSDPGPNAWTATAATYYWQVRATWTDAAGTFHSAASKVETIFIGTAPPPGTPPAGQPTAPGQSPSPSPSGGVPRTTLAMSALDATFYVRAVIRQRTHRQPRNLRARCARRSSRSFRCRPSWRDSRNVYSGTVTFTHARTRGRIVARSTFTGRRASRRCTRTRTVASCARRFRWHTVTAARPLGTARSR